MTWLATRAFVVKTDLEAAQQLVDQLQTELKGGDKAAMTATSAELQQRATSAANGTHDLTWRIAEFTPGAGQNLTAVRYVAESIEGIVTQVATPGVAAFAGFDISARDPETGGFDLTPLDEANKILPAAQTVFSEALEKLASADASALVGPVKDAVTKLDGMLTSVSDVVDQAAPLVKVAGAVLGQDGPRNYLMAFQNNAEATALGGSAASYTLLAVDHGAIAIAAQGAGSGDLIEGQALDIAVDQSALDLYTDYLIRYPNTSTSRPDFPTAGEIIQGYWLRDKGLKVDGVISVDPLALAQILKATGPVTLASGDVLSSDNAVQLLVNEIYFRYDTYLEPEKVDAFFQEAAASILNKLMTGDFDINKMMTALTDSVDTGSIMMWSSNPDEQSLLDGMRLQGVLPTSNDKSTVVGTYYRDTSASKIDYYLDTTTRTVSDMCTAPDNPTFTTTVTLHSNLTADVAEDLPSYILSREFGPDMFRTQVFVYGPVGATTTEARVDAQGEVTSVDPGGVDLGRPVAAFTAYLAPGETSTVTATFTGAPGEYGPLEARGTPMINTTQSTVDQPACG